MKNLLPLLLKLALLAPQVVKGVEVIGAERTSTDKKQMAHDALMLGTGVAAALDPADHDTIAAVSDHVAQLVDSFVGIFNDAGIFGHKPITQAATAQ